MRTVYLHIGMGRCGSSSLQEFAWRNSAVLEQAGIAVPTAGDLCPTGSTGQGGNATGLASTLRNHGSASPEGTTAINEAAAHLRSISAPNCLLSSEFFYTLPIADLANLKRAFNDAGFRVVVICYIREQREWMISRYGQAVKARKWTRTLEQYLRDHFRANALRFLKHFRPMRETFGADNLIIRVFERRRLTGGDVRRDLCDVLGVPASDMVFSTDETNASGNVVQIELMRIMNGAPKSAHFRFRNRDFLRTTDDLFTSGQMSSPKEMYRLVHPKVMAKVGAYFRRQNELFRAEFFPSLESPLFEERIPEKYSVFDAGDGIHAQAAVLLSQYVGRTLQRQNQAPPDADASSTCAASPGSEGDKGLLSASPSTFLSRLLGGFGLSSQGAHESRQLKS